LRTAGPLARRPARRGLALQETIGHRIVERIVEREQHDLLLSDIPGRVIGEAGTLGVVELLGVGVFPIISPAGVDVEHVAGHEAAAFEPLRLSIASMSIAVTAWPSAIAPPPPRWVLASSSTAVVIIGGTFSMPSLCNAESGVGFTSACLPQRIGVFDDRARYSHMPISMIWLSV
jgi:hypothetical protein